MAFKVNNPLKYTDPGKKLPKNPYPGDTTAGLESTKSFKIPAFLGIENTPDKDRATVERFGGSKVNSPYSSDARKRLNILNSASTTPIDPSKNVEIKTKIKSKTTQAGEAGYAADDLARKNKTGIYAPKKKKIKDREPSATNTETKASGRQSKLSQTSLGKKGKRKKFGDEVTMQSTRNNKKSTPKENTLDAINKVSMKKFVPASKKTTTVKSAPKNSRSDIKARKTADKKAGVSKSQMRANKAKSKSEAASAKAKKSKNPSYSAQLTAKSERLAKRAKRKGGSPAKAVGDPKDPKNPKATTKKAKKQRPGYKPPADAEKMPGKSSEAQALNTMNARDNKIMKANHLKADKNTKFPKMGDTLGLGHKVVGEDKETGDYFTRKDGKLPVYRVTRQNAGTNARQSLVKISNRKIKHGYNKDGSLYERK